MPDGSSGTGRTLAEFYTPEPGVPNPGKSQMRIAYVETPERMALVPHLLASLLGTYYGAKTAAR